MGSPYRWWTIGLGAAGVMAAGVLGYLASGRPETGYIAAVATVGALLALATFLRNRPRFSAKRSPRQRKGWDGPRDEVGRDLDYLRVELTNTSDRPVRIEKAFVTQHRWAARGPSRWVLMEPGVARVPPFVVEPFAMVAIYMNTSELGSVEPHWIILEDALGSPLHRVRLAEP